MEGKKGRKKCESGRIREEKRGGEEARKRREEDKRRQESWDTK